MAKIEMNPEELMTIVNEVHAILDEFETIIKPTCKMLSTIDYYEFGKAKSLMKNYPKMIDKTMEVEDLYQSASVLVYEIMNSMAEADEAIKKQIQESFHYYDWMA
ncbi:hypothetical protein ABEO79_00020 [Micromonospora provocatoris]